MLRRALLVLSTVLLAMLFSPPRPSAAGMDGVILRNGKMMMMKAGKAMDPMTASITMSDGAVVMLDGTVRLPGGEQLRLKDGQMVLMDGTIMSGGKPKPMMKPEEMNTE